MLIAGDTGGTKTEMATFSSKTGPHSPLDQTRVPGRRKLLIRSSIGQPCFNSDGWWAPGSTTIETTSLGVQVGGEKINLVVLSLDKDRRASFFRKGSLWGLTRQPPGGNGKSAPMRIQTSKSSFTLRQRERSPASVSTGPHSNPMIRAISPLTDGQ